MPQAHSGTRRRGQVPQSVPHPLPDVFKQCPRHGSGHAAESHCCAAALARRAQAMPAARARARGLVQLLCRSPCPVCSRSARARGPVSLLCRTPCPGTRLVPIIVPRPLPNVLNGVPGHAASSHCRATPLARRAQVVLVPTLLYRTRTRHVPSAKC